MGLEDKQAQELEEHWKATEAGLDAALEKLTGKKLPDIQVREEERIDDNPEQALSEAFAQARSELLDLDLPTPETVRAVLNSIYKHLDLPKAKANKLLKKLSQDIINWLGIETGKTWRAEGWPEFYKVTANALAELKPAEETKSHVSSSESKTLSLESIETDPAVRELFQEYKESTWQRFIDSKQNPEQPLPEARITKFRSAFEGLWAAEEDEAKQEFLESMIKEGLL